MRNEIVWITLPKQERTSIQEIISLIKKHNLSCCSVKQLINKLENHKASDWVEILEKYNAISSIQNINTLEMLNRVKSIRNKFRERGFPELETKEFLPSELLSLVILCYSNPNLIGPKLCSALSRNDGSSIKKEILENSAYVRAEGRVVPWASNLRLINFSLYSNNECVRLPDVVLSRIKTGAEVRNITLIESDQTKNSCSVQYANKLCNLTIAENSQAIGEIFPALSFENKQLNDASSVTYSKANFNSMSSTLITGLVAFHFFKNFPIIAPVVRNLNNSMTSGLSKVAHFFTTSRHKEIDSNQQSALNEVSRDEKVARSLPQLS